LDWEIEAVGQVADRVGRLDDPVAVRHMGVIGPEFRMAVEKELARQRDHRQQMAAQHKRWEEAQRQPDIYR
jgi:hypothetical protein